MKLIIAFSLMSFVSFCSNAQTVIDKSKTEVTKKDGIGITTFENKPYTGYLIESYANGKPKTWITMKDGLANGPWQEWLENGNLRYDSTWKDGKAHGLWKYFHDNGALRYEEAYIMDIPNGISRAYFNSGILQHDFFFLQGKKQGAWSYYTETGVLIKTEIYDNDKLVSTTEK